MDTLLIDTPSVLAAFDEVTEELKESARLMREYAAETVPFDDGNGSKINPRFRLGSDDIGAILEEARGLDVAAGIVQDMRYGILPA